MHTRQLVDWRAAIIAGIVAGAVFLLLAMFLTAKHVGNPWFFFMKSWIMLMSHIAFGVLAGGIDEALEIERSIAAH